MPLLSLRHLLKRAAESQSHHRFQARAGRALCEDMSSRWVPGGHERKHFERRMLPFAPAELYSVVADVGAYSLFVPWCTESRIVRVIDETHMAAELAVGFRAFSERYTSLVTLNPYRAVTVDVPNSALFDYLINDWTFDPGPTSDTTQLSFAVEFRFRNPVYQRISDMFFNEVVKNMVGAFEKRAHAKFSRHRRRRGVLSEIEG
jgi:ribosome-associated toxin RatA of RatAB toxin-antitoxin module